MVRGQRAVIKASLLAMMAVAASGGLGHAQTINSAKTGTVSLSTRLSYDTNPNLQLANPTGAFTVSEALNFGLLTETRNQQFGVNGGATAQYVTGGGGFALTRPDLRLRYSLDALDSDFNASLGYREVDVAGVYDIDPSSAVILVSDPGTLLTLDGSASVRFGKTGPLPITGGVNHASTTVQNTLDPSLFDTRNTVINGQAGLRFSPVTQGTFNLSHNIYSADDATQTSTNTTTADFSVSHEIKSALTVTGNIGYLRRDLELNGTSNVRNGFKAGVSVDQAHARGNVFGRFSYDQTGPSNRTSLTLGGNQQLPTGGVDASVTAANVRGSGLQLIGNAGYDRQFSDGSFRLNLNQAFQTDQNDNETLTSQLGFSYLKNVTANSNLNLNLNYTRIEDAGNGNTPTQSRATIGAAYDRTLTPDWNMQLGYTHRFLSNQNGTANSDSVYLSISRNVQFSF